MSKFIKYLAVITSVFILTACSMQALAEKILPEIVQVNAAKIVDAVLRKDPSVFESMQNEMSDEDFTSALDNMFTYVSDGKEIRRDIVGAKSKFSSSLGKGTNKFYNVLYEIQTEQGFTVVSIDYVQTPEQDECCELQSVNVQKSENSPYRIPFVKAVKIAGLITLLAIILLVSILVLRSRRRRNT